MSSTLRTAVVIPVLDEREAVESLFEAFAELAATEAAVDIVVVDGGSRDGTVEAIERFASRLPLETLRLERGRGLGEALEYGLEHALGRHDVVVTMDGDGSHDPALIPVLLERIGAGADVVIASRFIAGGKEIGVAAHRRLLSHGASWILRSVVPYPPVRDYSSGYRAYRAGALARVRDRSGRLVTETGFACQFELLLALRAVGAIPVEVPLDLRYDLKASDSKMVILPTMLSYGKLLFRSAVGRQPVGADA